MNTETTKKKYIGTLYITKNERIRDVEVEANSPEEARELMEQIYWDSEGTDELDETYYIKYDDTEVEAMDIEEESEESIDLVDEEDNEPDMELEEETE